LGRYSFLNYTGDDFLNIWLDFPHSANLQNEQFMGRFARLVYLRLLANVYNFIVVSFSMRF